MKIQIKIAWSISLLLLITSCSAGGENPPAADLNPTSTLPPPTQTSQPDPTQTNPSEPLPTAIPTAVPITESEYQGFWTYTNPSYGFSLQLPADWVINEISQAAMDGHTLEIQPRDDGSHLLLRMTFREVGETSFIWPTGVGAGEFLEGEMLEIAGEPAKRNYFVCPTGQVNSIWYMGTDTPHLQTGPLEYGFLYTYSEKYCEEGYSLGGKEQHIGELIIASLEVP